MPVERLPSVPMELKVGDILIPRQEKIEPSNHLGVSKIHLTGDGCSLRACAIETKQLTGEVQPGTTPDVVFYRKSSENPLSLLTNENFIKLEGIDWRDLVSE